MKGPRRHRPAPVEAAAPAASRPAVLGAMDIAISGVVLGLVLGTATHVGWHYRQQANAADRTRTEITAQCRKLNATIRFVENRRQAQSQFRRTVARYVAEVESRPIIPWTTAVNELTRRRPHGVWATRMSGDGPRFRVQVTSAAPGQVGFYAQALRESPYTDYATLPPGTSPAMSSGQVVGRLMGE